jgi:hypothetical protein
VTGFAETFGYGTDPEGDAARRAEHGVVELPDGTTVAGVPARELPAVATRLERLAVESTRDRLLRAVGITRAEVGLPELPDGIVEGELLDPRLSEHEVEVGETRSGLGWARCACGQWEAVVTGPASARWAFEQYAEHLHRALGE